MSGREPTDEQRAAIALRGASVALGAGAGCGKTFVLTERFLGALDEGLSLTELVAVTFTDKAATELRGRIRSECRRRLSGRGPDGPLWRATLRGLESSRIGTFHSFCADLIRRYPVEAGVAPDTEVLDAKVAPTLRDEALSGCMRRWLADGQEDFEALAIEFGLDSVRQGLRDLLARRWGGALERWAGESPETLRGLWEQVWKEKGLPAVRDLHLARPVADCLEVLGGDEWSSHPKAVERRAVLWAELHALVGPIDGFTIEKMKEVREHLTVKSTLAKEWPSGEVYERVKARYESTRKAIDKALGAMSWDEAATVRSAEAGIRFARLGMEARAAYNAMKAEREVIDFDDQLERALFLAVEGPEEARREIAGAIALLMVDEFQDTDPVQADILRALAGEEATAGKMFLVGDTKQSIYRFRGAVPGLFGRFRESFPAPGHRWLTANFRSDPGVIAFVNALFDGSPLYAEAGAALRAGLPAADPGHPSSAARPPAVEFLWGDEPDEGMPRESAGADEKPKKEDHRRAEARRLAALLAARLDRGWPIWDGRKREWRNAMPGDVAMLFRTVKSAGPYEQALMEAGLDFHTIGGSAFFAQQEVLDLINLLTTLEDPLDPLALAATLRSPFFGVSDEGLYWLSTTRPGDLTENLDRLEDLDRLSADDRQNALRAREMLGRWRARKDREPVAAILAAAVDESGYEAALLAERFGPRRRANVRKLIGLARTYDRAGFALADVAARLRNDLRRATDEDQAATTTVSAEAVQLMTVHKSKGLEFPIVVLPDLGGGKAQPLAKLAFHKDLGPLAAPEAEADGDEGSEKSKAEPKSLGRKLAGVLEAAEDREEALRLFYVATTRAMNHLILSATEDAGKVANSSVPALQLLAKRFDPATGAARDGGPVLAELAVVPDWRGPEVVGAKGDRVAIVEVLEAGLRAAGEEGGAGPPASSPRWPSWIDLDEAPGRSAHDRRVDALVLALLRESHGRGVENLEERAATLGRKLVPAASRRVVAAAVDRLAGWLGGAMARRKGGEWVVGWERAWEPGRWRALAARGTLEWFGPGVDGGFSAVVLARPGVPEEWERIRLLLGARAMVPEGEKFKGGVVDPSGARRPQGEEDLSDRAIERAVEAAMVRVGTGALRGPEAVD